VYAVREQEVLFVGGEPEVGHFDNCTGWLPHLAKFRTNLLKY